ncbi:hypothetical protein [Devosia sp. UYZn731]|uniref:hypothetical protein n=1 Tax=Devosia sp. UYZn731 TaxID=3156345 RepID=UPI00339ACB77
MDFQSHTSLIVSVFYPFLEHGDILAGDRASIPNSRNPWGFTLQVNSPREALDTDLGFSAQVRSNDKLLFAGGAVINGISAASKPIRLALAYQLPE